jgi:hypothetical protein
MLYRLRLSAVPFTVATVSAAGALEVLAVPASGWQAARLITARENRQILKSFM